VVRGRIGFAGGLISDDLGMEALEGAPAARARAAIEAGCDVALYCAGDLAASAAVCDAAGPVGAATRARVTAARDWVARHRQAGLDLAVLEAERAGLVEAVA